MNNMHFEEIKQSILQHCVLVQHGLRQAQCERLTQWKQSFEHLSRVSDSKKYLFGTRFWTNFIHLPVFFIKL